MFRGAHAGVQGPERVPNQAVPASTRPCCTLESQCPATFISVGGRRHRKLKNKVKGKRAVQPRPGQASKGADQLSGCRSTQPWPIERPWETL